MISKKALMRTLENLPEDFSMDDLLDRIILLQKIEIGMEQSQAGHIHSTKQAKERLKKWLE